MKFLLYAKISPNAGEINRNIRRKIERQAIKFFQEDDGPKGIKSEHFWGRATDRGGWVAIVDAETAEALWTLVTGDLSLLFDIQAEPLVGATRPDPANPGEANLRRLIPESLGNGAW